MPNSARDLIDRIGETLDKTLLVGNRLFGVLFFYLLSPLVFIFLAISYTYVVWILPECFLQLIPIVLTILYILLLLLKGKFYVHGYRVFFDGMDQEDWDPKWGRFILSAFLLTISCLMIQGILSLVIGSC